MEENTTNKHELKDKLLYFYKKHKFKVFLVIFLTISVIAYFPISGILKEKKNSFLSEKYIDAGLLLASGEKEKSKIILEEIILSKNKFYSPLALKIILESNLYKDNKRIINFFNIIEEISLEESQRDLILIKKALFLINNVNKDQGEKILKRLIESNSDYKDIAEELIDN